MNALAIEEHDETVKRHDFLVAQRTDLFDAKASLLQAIKEIDATARELFLATFSQVRENFRTIFMSLFGGGECDLRLENPDAPLDCDIEIHASPRGKKTQRINLLSSGERALVALSLLFGIFAYVVLSILGVPQPLLLAILAAVADAIPVVGVAIATIPAVLLALTISTPVAGIVLALYLAYQQVENYVIVPRVYRGTLELHPFAVLLAVLVGAQLLGVLGVLLALPIAAAVPVIERIWGGRSSSGAAVSLPVPATGAPVPPETDGPA